MHVCYYVYHDVPGACLVAGVPPLEGGEEVLMQAGVPALLLLLGPFAEFASLRLLLLLLPLLLHVTATHTVEEILFQLAGVRVPG